MGGGTWLVMDQRFVDGRTDVLTYVSAPLTTPLRVSGVPEVNLYASTSGTDSDWAVKLIDVYPGTVESQPGMGGYELAISLDIFRGRYRTSFEHRGGDCIESAAAVSLRAADGESRVSAGASRDGAGAVDDVSAVRPQSADICAEYFRCEAGGLSEGDAAGVARAGHGKFYQLAGGALRARATPEVMMTRRAVESW